MGTFRKLQLRLLQSSRELFIVAMCLWIATVVYFGGKNYYVVSTLSRALGLFNESRTPSRKTINISNISSNRSSSSLVSNDSSRQLKLIRSNKTNRNFHITKTAPVTEADNMYYEFLQHLDYKCEDHVRLGDVIDGGYGACVVEPYQFRRPCLVYSFGINYDFSFDDAVSIKFGCTVRSFDPSMNVTDHRRDDNIWFYKLGLGWSDRKLRNGWKTMKLQSIVDMLGDSEKIIDYLKIDVEDNEWPALEAMFKTNVLERVKQLAIEVHVMPRGTASTKIFFTRWRTLTRLQRRGFRKWAWHFNPAGGYEFHGKIRSCCYDLIYINENFLTRAFSDDKVTANTSGPPQD